MCNITRFAQKRKRERQSVDNCTSLHDGGVRFPFMVRDLLKKPTFGDGIITKPSSAALSRNLWMGSGEGTSFEMANEVMETDPFVLVVSSVTLVILTGSGIGGGKVLICSVKSLTTRR